MSNVEDELMLEDIRALEVALLKNTNDTSSKSEYSVKNLKTEIIHGPEPEEEIDEIPRISPTPESAPFCNNENLTGDSALALRLNKQLIERLLSTREEVVKVLEECRRKKEIINQKLKIRLKVGAGAKVLTSHAGMPYFKDKDFFSAPANEDTKLKEARGELQIIHLRRVSRWTAKDKQLLLSSINSEVVEMLKLRKGNEKLDPNKLKMGKNSTFSEIVLEEIGPLGHREFDWMKIAATDFQNKHSSEECRVMWNIFLHPSINKFKWKKKELSDLDKYVKQYKNENWDEIAKKLGTQRSGYQCFVKYNTMKKLPQNDKPWTKQEDKKLIQLINKFKIGDFINWGDVASCVKSRTKHQIYFRWMYSLAPHLKKGRFTDDEDKLLMKAIDKYGPNFKKISALVLPARTSAQLSDHFNTLANKDDNVWTIKQDKQLVSLHLEFGKDWAKIATYFPTKTRIQLRHRYNAIARYEKRGVELHEIPRHHAKEKSNKNILVFHKIPVNVKIKQETPEVDEVDLEIVEYFQSVNIASARAGRKAKFYNSKELESTARKMYNILHMMSANLCIPEDLDEYECLTEKDKQLLLAIKYLPSDATKGYISRNVEQMRLKMFPPNDNNKTEHFVPPLPFGGHMRTNKSNQMINYSLYIDTNFMENREMKFETPENIIDVIGEETNHVYDKIGQLLVKSNYVYERPAIEKIYILRPGEFVKKEVIVSQGSQKVFNLFQSFQTTSRITASDPSTFSKFLSGDMHMENYPSIKPNYWTLIGYQGIQRVRKTMQSSDDNSDNEEIDLKKMTDKGKVALSVLRARLVQIFKYPAIMSQIMPPETIEERDYLFLPEDDDDLASCHTRKKIKLEIE